ncbi:MAG: molybdopterin-dependent oxidoreductase [Bryobacterales bacterium]|nr:molybdopterin-dependent oxidoreductase [Bryobacterales bacterium]
MHCESWKTCYSPTARNSRRERRQWISVVAAGLFIPAAGEVAFSPNIATAQIPPSSGLHIGEDGSLTVLTVKVGVGRGWRTEILQVAAEELRPAPETLRMMLPDAATTPDEGSTAGSQAACLHTDSVR